MYPRENAESSFNLEHYVAVHLKLGFRLMQKHYGFAPEAALVQHSTRGMDGTPASSPYLAVCWVMFRTRADADRFIEIFGIGEVAAALTADWKNYCPLPPKIAIGEVMELSGADILKDSEPVLRQLNLVP
jgi:hypothetical protein